MYIDK